MSRLRRTGATTVATVLGLSFAVVLANAIAPQWTHQVGIDVWNLPSAMEESRVADEELIALDKKEERLCWEIQMASHLAMELANGTMPLREAVDEMEPILGKRAGFLLILEVNYHTTSLRQGVARYLINRISFLKGFEIGTQNDVLDRLEREYRLLSGV